ncbi:MAG: outer membrane lipoprotein-sorting protein [Ignavibacteriaceae bacterium]
MTNFSGKISIKCWLQIIFVTALLSFQIKAQTVDEIIAKNLKARGGIENIKEINTQRFMGRISFGSDSAKPFMVEMKRPGKMRDEIIINGVKIIRTTTGKSGWVLNPLSGSDTARPMNAGELKNTAGSADIEGPLVDYKAKGNKIEFAGKEKVEGKDAYKLIVTMKDGDVRNDYIDCKSFLEVKWIGNILSNGKKVKVETYFRNYKKVDGLMYAFLLDTNTPGTTYKQQIIIKKVEVNIPLDDALFEKPVMKVKDQN